MGDQGFAVGNRPSIADASLYFCFGEVCAELKGGPYESVAEPFGDLAATRSVLKLAGLGAREYVRDSSSSLFALS